MQKQGKNYTFDREKALAEGIKEVASELRLIEAADFVAFIRTDQFANIANLVNSSTELYFKPDTITFGLSGDVNLQWGGTPFRVARHGIPPHAGERLLPPASGGAACRHRDRLHHVRRGLGRPRPEYQRLVQAIANARLRR